MSCLLPMRNLRFSLMTTASVIAAAAALSAPALASANRPANVPEGYAATPVGYFHPSCVKQVAKDDVLRPDERAIYHADGTIDSMPACAYQHYTSDGQLVPMELATVPPKTSDSKLTRLTPGGDEESKEPPYISHSWMVDVEAFTSSSYGKITSKVIVPKAPSSHDGQIIYLFPGMQDNGHVKTIVQPVLSWNTPYYKKGDVWSITSWNCCTKGTLFVSPGEGVNTGDTIYGEIYDQCSAGTLECGKWTIYTKDETNGAWTKLYNESNFGQTFNWAFGTALEVYYVKQCSDYPEGGKLVSSDVTLYNDKFQVVKPTWYTSLGDPKGSPQCGYNGYLDGNDSTLLITY
jgi:hypothetical protein